MILSEIQEFYFVRLAAAMVRGKVLWGQLPSNVFPEAWVREDWATLSDLECVEITQAGLASGLRLHRFKRTMNLSRVTKVLGMLRAFDPGSLLDIGSGRGAFLWPLLDAFPNLPVMAVETSAVRARQIETVAAGGVKNISVIQGDVTKKETVDSLENHDVVTALEVLEHVPEVEAACRACVRLANRAVLVSVPSKEDDNPEHIHLLTRSRLEGLFDLPEVKRIQFDAVPGHLLAVVTLKTENA